MKTGKHTDPAPRGPAGEMNDGVPCPFCDERETRLISPFGGQLSVAQYWCRRCRTGFDYMKWEDRPAPAG
jgi:hypothetical protein